MSDSINFIYDFHPAGQGTFASGLLTTRQPDEVGFRWVFDCGSTASKQVLYPRVIDYRRNAAGNRLDLLCISHFDNDHVSGLSALLSGMEVGTIVLPYFSPLQRLVLGALREDVPEFFVRWVSNPVAWLLETAASVERIVIVGPGSGDSDEPGPSDRPPNSPFPQQGSDRDGKGRPWRLKPHLPDPPNDKGMTGCVSEQTQAFARSLGTELIESKASFAADVVASSTSIGWEFLFYHKPQPEGVALQLRQGIKSLFSSQNLPPGINIQTALASPEMRKKIRTVYEDILGSDEELNAASLCVYSGPIEKDRSSIHRSINDPVRFPPSPISRHNLHRVDRMSGLYGDQPTPCSILYTGDADFREPTDRDHLRAFLTMQRMAAVAVMQIPHHGSRNNWQAGSASEFSHWWSVFCADPDHRHGHPNREVLLDLVLHSPLIVDKVHEWRWHGEVFSLAATSST